MSEFKYVPVGPTDEMIIAASQVGYPLTRQNILRVWKSMLAAAPTHPFHAESMDREAPTVPSNIAYLIEQYGNARADGETTSTA